MMFIEIPSNEIAIIKLIEWIEWKSEYFADFFSAFEQEELFIVANIDIKTFA